MPKKARNAGFLGASYKIAAARATGWLRREGSNLRMAKSIRIPGFQRLVIR